MKQVERDKSKTPHERDGDTEQELRQQGYSQTEIEQMQRQLDSGGEGAADLEQLPHRLLVQRAIKLDIEGAEGLKKEQLIDAIRDAT